MPPEENPLAMAQRHIIEGEGRIARQVALVERLRALDSELLAQAECLLGTMQETLDIARDHLRIEWEKRGEAS